MSMDPRPVLALPDVAQLRKFAALLFPLVALVFFFFSFMRKQMRKKSGAFLCLARHTFHK